MEWTRNVDHLDSEQPLRMAVAKGRALIQAGLMELGDCDNRNCGFQQMLKAGAHDLSAHGACAGAMHELYQLLAPLWVCVMVCLWFGGSEPNMITAAYAHCHS
ncbi:hypothetical protein MITS9508_00579 [Synechococcus sp. MIT S9508]|nr:hypothetical protein MITS9508_00579 [Synechococcus sp. MIT S9508]